MFSFDKVDKDLIESNEIPCQKSKTQHLGTILEEGKSGWGAEEDILISDQLFSKESQASGINENVENPKLKDIEEINTDQDTKEVFEIDEGRWSGHAHHQSLLHIQESTNSLIPNNNFDNMQKTLSYD